MARVRRITILDLEKAFRNGYKQAIRDAKLDLMVTALELVPKSLQLRFSREYILSLIEQLTTILGTLPRTRIEVNEDYPQKVLDIMVKVSKK